MLNGVQVPTTGEEEGAMGRPASLVVVASNSPRSTQVMAAAMTPVEAVVFMADVGTRVAGQGATASAAGAVVAGPQCMLRQYSDGTASSWFWWYDHDVC